MIKYRIGIIILNLLVFSFSLSSAQSETGPTNTSFEEVVDAYNQVYGFSGRVKVVNGEHIMLDTATGYADRSFHIPNSRDTRFSINSISKTFVAVAVLLLLEDDRIDLSAPLSEYLPDLVVPWADEITVHQLLSHTSGLPREIGLAPDSEASLVEQLPMIAQAVPLFPPGEKYSYSNMGYALLGLIVQEVSGMTYEDFVHERIIIPAGLKNTGFYRGREVVENQAVPYRITAKGLEFTQRCKTYGQNPGGGMFSTLDDLYDYVLALEKGTVLEAASVRKMFTPWAESAPGELEAYTWGLKLYNGDTIRLAAGSGYGTKSVVMRIPDRDVFIGITSNFGNVPVLGMLRDLLLTLEGEAVTLPEKGLLADTGAYLSDLGTYCFDEDALRSTLGAQDPCLVLHTADGRLFIDDEVLVSKGQGKLGLTYTDELALEFHEGIMTIYFNGVILQGIRK